MPGLRFERDRTARLTADFRLVIVEDCCADNEAAVHDFLCSRIFPRQAEVVRSSDVIRALGV